MYYFLGLTRNMTRILSSRLHCLLNGYHTVSPIPIDDFNETSAAKYSDHEKNVRRNLASLYRLVDMRGWSMGIYNHITARIDGGGCSDARFLVNVFGLLYDEVTASNLVTVDLAGRLLDPGSLSPALSPSSHSASSSTAGVNVAGYVLHSAIHEHRPDIMCAVHVHLPEVIAVSSMKCGLLAVSQEAVLVLEAAGVCYHDYQGVLIRPTEKADIQHSLGPRNKVLMLRNHGALVCGASVEEAYLLLDTLVLACRSQVALSSCAGADLDRVTMVSHEARRNVAEMMRDGLSVDSGEKARGERLQLGMHDFEAAMRQLDRAGLRTGYQYRKPWLAHCQPHVDS